jgi:hypothetical protein
MADPPVVPYGIRSGVGLLQIDEDRSGAPNVRLT